MSTELLISEIFGPTIQGEGALIGTQTVFVRAAGCDFRCRWCDTLYAVDRAHRHGWRKMTSAAVLAEVVRLSDAPGMLITLSGGNPALQPFGPLIAAGRARGYGFALETQGSRAAGWFADLDALTLSPKPPSAGVGFSSTALKACIAAAGRATAVSLKFPILDQADFAFARRVAAAHPTLPVYLQPVNHTPAAPHPDGAAGVDLAGVNARLGWLADQVAAHKWTAARVLPQLHVLLWGNARGV